jgi:UDP:flavonoid glycosyltransferase YjiC (YdhE family)
VVRRPPRPARSRSGGRGVLSGTPPRSRIAVVAGPDPGHALPALGLAAALRRRGHTVALWTGLGHDATAAAHGVEVHQLPLLAPTADDADIGHRLWIRAGEMAVPLAADLRRWSPAVVVVDTLTRAGAFAAELLGLPWVELVPHHLDDPDPDLPPIGLGRRPARTPVRRADDRRLVRLQLRSYQRGAAQAAAVAASLGLPDPGRPVLRLVGTLPALERPRGRWPEDAHVVGPLALDPVGALLAPPEGPDPLVLVTDSTASGVERSLGEVALRALDGLDLRVVVTSGRLPPRRSSRRVVGAGPHRPLLDQAQLAVTFGGAGFTSKAVAAGVPLVVVPLQGDQREVAARLEDAGAGRTLPLRRLTPRRLRWTVVRCLADPEPRQAARRLADQAARLGPQVAADLVAQVLLGARPTATGPTQHLRAAACARVPPR